MADSLDDFFAKKDKKRGKDKGKTVLSAEALVRELEEGSKQVDFPSRKENKTSTAIELLGLDADDADWRDFEDVEKRDYTGLKVKEMSLQDQTDEEQRRLTAEQSEPVTESTPWKMRDESTSATTEPSSNAKSGANQSSSASNQAKIDIKAPAAPISSSSDQKDDKSGKKDGATESSAKEGDSKPSAKPAKYIPPSERMQDSLEPVKLSTLRGTRPVSGRPGAIPNIQDQKAFPSLG